MKREQYVYEEAATRDFREGGTSDAYDFSRFWIEGGFEKGALLPRNG